MVWYDGVAVDGSGNVWVLGRVGTSSPPTTMVYWENGGSYSAVTGASSNGGLVADASGSIYFVGVEGASGYTPYYWKNANNPQGLQISSPYTNGYPNNISLSPSGSLYVGGTIWDTSGAIPVVWSSTNATFGAPTALATGTYSSNPYWETGAVAVDSSGNVDVLGYTSPTSSAYTTILVWKGISATPAALSLNGNSFYHQYGSKAAAVDSSGNLYVVESIGSSSSTTIPVYWENGGSPVALPMGSTSGVANTYGQANTIVIGQ